MFEDVFEELPWHLEEQSEQAIRERHDQVARMSARRRRAVTLADAPARAMTMIEAINDALDTMLERDPDVVLMGEDVGYFGGVFRCTAGLQEKHGKTRVFDTPISECGIIGVAVGMGAYGLRPVPEIQFADYIYPGLDQLVSEAARLRYRSAGEFIAPMTVRSPFGGGIFGGQTHSQSPEAHVHPRRRPEDRGPEHAARRQGPADRGDRGQRSGDLLRAQADLQRPVRRLLRPPDAGRGRTIPTRWCPKGYYSIPLGKARIVREGSALTVLAYGTMVHVAEAVCREKGVDAEIIDLRTLVPLDIEAVEKSVEKTGRCMVVARGDAHVGLRRRAGRAGAGALLLPPRGAGRARDRLRHPYPHSLEWAYFPGPIRVGEAIDKLLEA